MDQNSAPVEDTGRISSDATKKAPGGAQSSVGGSLSFKEKYFQIEPEGRIRRYQYFVRSIIPAILFGLAFMIIGMILAPLLFILGKISVFVGLLVWGLAYWYLFNMAKAVTVKRAHDFGSDGKIATYIVTASFAMGVIGLVVTVLQTYGIIPLLNPAALSFDASGGDIGSVMKAMQDAQPTYIKVLGYLNNIVSIASFIMWVVLVFRPGVSGDNQYGRDSANNKVSFLG